MIKFLFSLFLFFTISSCVNNDSASSDSTPRPEKTQSVSVELRTNFLKKESHQIQYFEIQYFSFTRKKEGTETLFLYKSDSVLYSNEMKIITASLNPKTDSEYQTHIMTLSIGDLHDTLYLSDQQEGDGNYASHYQYILNDSIDFKMEKKSNQIYGYKRIDEDPRWDETIYLPKKYGFLYSNFRHSETNQELLRHGNLDSLELKELLHTIKSHSK
jgi:hypothetical protein